MLMLIGPTGGDTYGIGVFDQPGEAAIQTARDGLTGIAFLYTTAAGTRASISSGPGRGAVRGTISTSVTAPSGDRTAVSPRDQPPSGGLRKCGDELSGRGVTDDGCRD